MILLLNFIDLFFSFFNYNLILIYHLIFLFFFSIFGVFLTRRNALMVLMCLELSLIFLNGLIVLLSILFDDLYGEICSFFLFSLGAYESVLGLALILLYYKHYNLFNTYIT